MDRVAPLTITRAVWRQTRPTNELLDVAHPATHDSRYTAAGRVGVWYASLSERGAWAELFKHWGQEEVSPFEVRRRVGRVRVTDLRVLDLTDASVRRHLNVSEDDLIGDDWAPCQKISIQAHSVGFEGILAPSAALAGETTLVVFPEGIGKLDAEHSRVQRPPIRMLDVLTAIRLRSSSADTVGSLYRALAALARRVRGRRQRR